MPCCEIFGADPRDIFLRANVTEVINEFVLGLSSQHLPQGCEVAITDLEYGAVTNLVRHRCERDGLKEVRASIPLNFSRVSKTDAGSGRGPRTEPSSRREPGC